MVSVTISPVHNCCERTSLGDVGQKSSPCSGIALVSDLISMEDEQLWETASEFEDMPVSFKDMWTSGGHLNKKRNACKEIFSISE